MTKKCILVDDEPIARSILEQYIDRIDGLTLISSCSSAVEAYNFLNKERIDIMFLDIRMPDLSGLQLLESLSHPPKTIITTAYRDYAVEGFDLNVADYLLKPISFNRFLKAINRIIPLTNMESSIRSQPSYLYIKSDKKYRKVLLNDILYIEGLSNYMRIKTRNDKEIVTYQKLSTFESQLRDSGFIRIHRSFIVSIDKIEGIKANSIEIGKKELPIGSYYKKNVFDALKL